MNTSKQFGSKTKSVTFPEVRLPEIIANAIKKERRV
jgi:hypothetical protein